MKSKKNTAIFVLILMLFNTISGLVPQSTFAAVEDDLLLHYDMKNIDGTTVQDSSANGYDGELVNEANSEVVKEDNYGYVSLAGGSSSDSSYVSIPEGVLDKSSEITVSTLVKWDGTNTAEWLYALGQDNSRYLYFTPEYNADSSARFGIATDGWRNEVSARQDAALAADEWKLVTTIISEVEETLELYIDGERVATGSTEGFTLDDIKNQNGISGYIGRSMYAGDPYFGGDIADFRIYNKALSTSEMAQLKTQAENKINLIEGTTPVSENGELILHYDMKSTQETGGQVILNDISGSDTIFNGIFKNPENGDLVKNSEAGYVAFDGGSSDSESGFVEIPKSSDGSDVLTGLEDVTVSTLVNWNNDGTNRWIFGLGRVDSDIENGNGYFFVTPRHGVDSSNDIATGISEAGWRNEALIRGDETLESDSWQVVTAVFSGSTDTLTLYVNGEEVTSGSVGGKKLSQIIDAEADFSGFIGKSIFTNDAFYSGMVGDFRIYDGALTDEEVATLATQTTSEISEINQLVISDAENELDITDYLAADDASKDEITQNLNLPDTGKHNVTINWSSNNPGVISNDGVVTRPTTQGSDGAVVLTATLSHEGLTAEKTFNVTVLKEYSNQQRVDFDANEITIYNKDNVKGNLGLPTSGENGSTITWESSNIEVVKGSEQAREDAKSLGVVTRASEDTVVTLTATVSNGDAETEKSFDVTVIADPGKKDYDAYFFSYFTGEYEGGEEISFATAEEPLNWRALNNGQSVIQSTMGEKGLRDPFVMRSPEGDKFYMIATDLKMGESTNFDQAQITGSHSLMIWESEDLVNWSEQRMVEVAPENGGNTWAPEAYYDEKTGEYVVFWASSIDNDETYGNYPNGRPNGQYNVMYYATTRDFHEFSEPKVMIDDGFPTIDTSFVQDGETLYRFTKSEVNYKVYYEKATNIFDDADNIVENGFQFEPIEGTKNGNQGLIGHGGNNEGQTVFKDIHEDKWYLFLDSWPYHVRWTDDLEDGEQLVNNVLDDSEYALPPGPRHGTVIPITRAEYDALQAKYTPEAPEASTEPVVHYTFDNADGTTVKDVTDNGYDAELIGGANIDTVDKVGDSEGSVSLDGSSGYVELPANIIQDLNLKNMTMSSWVKVNSDQTNQRIFDFASDTGRTANRNTMYLSTQGDTGTLEFAAVTPFTEKFSNASSTLGTDYKYAVRAPRLSTQTWHHVAMTIEGFDAVLYVDGEEVSRKSTYNMEPRMLMETTMNYLGKSRSDNHNLFDGKFDEFKIFNRALTEAEVTVLADEEMVNPEDPSDEENLVTDVTLDQETVELTEGESSQLTATVIPDTAVNKAVAWVSSNEEVATVDESGNVTAVKAGTAFITVTTADGGHMATSEVTVEEATDTTPGDDRNELTLGGDSQEVEAGETYTVTGTSAKVTMPADLPVGTKMKV
ncbi:LamG-like jellyroll fold domain-containing protein, partial [Aquibacillus rhizosphaerae]